MKVDIGVDHLSEIYLPPYLPFIHNGHFDQISFQSFTLEFIDYDLQRLVVRTG